jgi:hypothetical protein
MISWKLKENKKWIFLFAVEETKVPMVVPGPVQFSRTWMFRAKGKKGMSKELHLGLHLEKIRNQRKRQGNQIKRKTYEEAKDESKG